MSRTIHEHGGVTYVKQGQMELGHVVLVRDYKGTLSLSLTLSRSQLRKVGLVEVYILSPLTVWGRS